MKNLIMTVCGISVLLNYAEGDERKLVLRYANCKDSFPIPEIDRNMLHSLISRSKSEFEEADNDSAVKKSAEINALVKFYKQQFVASADCHLLLCTDTWLGEEAAKIVADWLRIKKQNVVEIKRQRDLQTANIAAFNVALSDLVRWCDETLVNYRQSGYHVVFNLTAGFKSIQGFLQTLATFYADETIYIFETAEDLLHIPRLPVEMKAQESIKRHLTIFRRMSMGLPVEGSAGIPETMLLECDGQTTLSSWGELVWVQSKKTIYAEELWPTPSTRLAFSTDFEKSLKGLSPDRLVMINEKIDQLVRCLEQGGQYNVSSLDFKVLQGTPCLPSTHELDAWADQDAKRIFGHYDKDVFFLDRLDKALH
jgi:putative CRISPR-associated protein (TIGR02619 family)